MPTLASAQGPWFPTRMLIGGRLVAGEGQAVTVRNPSSGEITTEFAGASLDQTRAAIAAARTAADKGEWAATPLKVRIAKVRALLGA